ncbi:MAG: enoyl-CoA hydratase/isomerase family protein [Chloroflexi bacterium]|nr:enoyl-CoA hydratase/isomerase family protein [Chloroflexota bacterium]MBI3733826.1 enoyl-CoA hydratase/isomerase family protein [Chloroflexota bacterium]
MTIQTVIVEKENGVALITLSHPPVNAINLALLEELERALAEIDSDDTVRAVIVTGAGEKVFSAGADFQEFAGERVRQFQQKGARLFNQIEAFRKPIIAAINGGAYGGGFELAMSCHLRVMADTAQLALTEVRLGIIPGWGGTQRLPRLIGRTRALEYLLTGDRINAQDAMTYGLVNRVVGQAGLMAEARALAMRLARGAPLAMAAIIDCVARGLEMTVEEGLNIESAHALQVGQSEDALIGVMSFMQRQEPQFKGR